MNIFLLLSLISFILIIYWFYKKHNYWKYRNVESVNVLKELFAFKRPHIGWLLQKYYMKAYKENKAILALDALNMPSLLLQDLDIIKDVLITDFEYFPSHGIYENHKNDVLSGNLLRLNGELWRDMRKKLTPGLSSGKLRYMFPTMLTISERFVETLKEKFDKTSCLDLKLYNLCTSFFLDITTNVGFGLECNTLKNPSTEFKKIANKAVSQTLHPFFDHLGSKYTKLFHYLKIKVYSQELIDGFTQLVQNTIEYREKEQVKRKDFVENMMEIKNQQDLEDRHSITMQQITGQLFGFYLASFETSANTLTYILYEMAKNPEIQEKARKSIQQVMENNKQQITYESLKEMEYLNMIKMETLRKYPIAYFIPRVSSRPYTFKTSPPLTIPKGINIAVPVYGIHHNPDIFGDPAKFIPERFTLEEQAKRHALAYLPFGAGPRRCIGERFANLQLTIILSLLLLNFRFKLSPNTPENLVFDEQNLFILKLKKDIDLKIEKI